MVTMLGVVEGSSGLGLPAEPTDELLVDGLGDRDDLERLTPPQLGGVLHQVDGPPHAARAQAADHPVAGDLFRVVGHQRLLVA